MSSATDQPTAGTKVLALDVGDARIGLAVGQVGSSFAFGRGALTRVGTKRDVPAVLQTAQHEGASLIVVGLPLRLDGNESPQTARVRVFSAVLKEAAAPLDMNVLLEDERLTTRIAQREVGSSALPRGRRQEKGLLDEAAAVLILESFLERCAAANQAEQGDSV